MKQPNARIARHPLMRVMALASCTTLVVGCGGSSTPPSHVVAYSISVTVSGLSGTGLVLQVNSGNDLSISANGVATFPTTIDSGTTYSVTVSTQPTKPAQTCSVNNGSGTVGTAAITDILVTCAARAITLYSFNGTDGLGAPNGSLVQGLDGSLYGTTTGAVFRITTSGAETTLYSFSSATDFVGGTTAGLILANDGNFYGTTNGSGVGGNISGSVYRISPDGTESDVYAWFMVDGGDFPMKGGVIQARDGFLYGTVYGSNLFSLSIAGGDEKDVNVTAYGSVVESSLVQTRDGTLYGADDSGAVFKVVPNAGPTGVAIIGSIGIKHSGSVFSLIEGSDGNLYGTTSGGGSPSATCPNGCGTVFKITPSGVTTLLYSFGASPIDGQEPAGALVLASDGNFYGTTAAGGSSTPNCKSVNGCGTLYKITSDGTETVLYSFGTGPSDGTGPSGTLLQASDGSLYGTTGSGGSTGSGTVFKLELGLN